MKTLTRFELIDGWTEVMIIRTDKGVQVFPADNAMLVIKRGTNLSRERLRNTIGENEYQKLLRDEEFRSCQK